MEAKQELLLDFFSEPGACYAVPFYQRAYSWGVLQCDELWRDILRAARGSRTHFMGMVLYTEEEVGDDSGLSRRMVVDGQQRLVTVALILLALSRRLREEGVSLFGMDADLLAEGFLRSEDGYRFMLSRGDRKTLFALIDGAEPPTPAGRRLVDNLEFFERRMQDRDCDLSLLWRGLRSLLIIGVRLGEDDSPQAVFESLNSKGMPLTTADLVRNYLLVSETHREQARLFEEYWEPTQSAFGDDPGSLKLDNAICAWLDVRCESVHWDDEHTPFFVFKVYCEEEFEGAKEDLLRELRSFAQMWAESFRYHGVKKYRSYDWALNGPKTLVSNRPLVKCEDEELYEFYRRIYGINVKATW